MSGMLARIRAFIKALRARPTEPNNAFVERALNDDKREGLRLAIKARFFALGAVAVLTVFINPNWDVVFYLALLGLFALIGWLQLKVGRTGQSRVELFLIFVDLLLLTIVGVVPNPLAIDQITPANQYEFGGFIYFFILLAGGVMAYSWRTVIAMGVWTSGLWLLGLFWILWQPDALTDVAANIKNAVAGHQNLLPFVDINDPRISLRVQEIVVFLIVAIILAINARRAKTLLMKQAQFEREASNLSRYFSPSVVAQLSKNDQNLGETRTQEIAVLFVDIVGFTSMSEKAPPEKTIKMLRQFLNAMETEVFRHNGTLDKYLGDGLMATFGTPFPSENDASNALACARAMMERLKEINIERKKNGEAPLKAGFGLHYGEAVLGDIGANRLEFAVIGSTVNAAARLEALTRKLNVPLVASDTLMCKANSECEKGRPALPDFKQQQQPQEIRGFSKPMKVWTLQ